MHYQPYCVRKKHKCKSICISKNCQIDNPFICEQCTNHHQKECQIITYSQLIKRLHIKQGLNNKNLLKFQENVQETFKIMIKSLQAQFVNFRQIFQHLNASKNITQFYQLLKSHKERDMKASKIYQMLEEQISIKKFNLKNQAIIWNLSKEIIQLQKKVNSKLPHYYDISCQQPEISLQVEQKDKSFKEIQKKYRKYKKNLVNCILQYSIDAVSEFFQREIYNVQLLYKASKQNFSAEKFHTICDGKKNTLMMAKTQFGKIIGGFCSIPWKSPPIWQYQEDPYDETFIFSMSKYFKGDKFKPFKKKFSIGMHKQYGPCFGDDIVIYDNAHKSKGCWSNFPDCYKSRNQEYSHDQKTILQFIGVDDHFKKFNLLEWEVYLISFNANEQLQASFMQKYRNL